ncbi:MAG: DNA mismatch repair protein MutS [Bacillota bacterium]|nr:DNA mismatch repair protein MutS [Bacillota bacterium]
MSGLTPMMQQYQTIKAAHQDALLFYRLGDFYELFFDDALVASRELEITLTGRNCGKEERAPMCGVPHHSAQNYIDRLIRKGYKVAICEQTEDPAAATGIVRREVVRVITPGTIIDSQLLQEKQNHYLAAVSVDQDAWCLVYADLSTGELSVMTREADSNRTVFLESLIDELGRVHPGELLMRENGLEHEPKLMKWIRQTGIYLTDSAPYEEQGLDALSLLQAHFKEPAVREKLDFMSPLTLRTLAVLFTYLERTQKRTLNHLNDIIVIGRQQAMSLDLHTRQNMELTETLRDKQRKGSLLWVLDKTKTAMGGRLLKRWLEEPLIEREAINQRLDAVTYFLDHPLVRSEIRKSLQTVYDLERLVGKVAFQTANPRDLLALKQTLQRVLDIRTLLAQGTDSELVNRCTMQMDPKEPLIRLLEQAIDEDAPLSLKDGGVIKRGYHTEIDELKKAAREGKQWIADYEKQEREATGIKTLKTGFNRVFGYYIEVTKSNMDSVPLHYQRKQTLANCERYITDPLKDLEAKILGAEERSNLLESTVFLQIREAVAAHIPTLQQTARAAAALDVLAALSETAFQNRYQRPVITEAPHIKIKNGRHPVVEKTLHGELFVPNDTEIYQNQRYIHLITGPNMAGKSTYMRQVALIVLMAQMGSYVPADAAHVGVVDRLFTRIGASDDLSQGRSTFMVEMSEVSAILRAATDQSLIILDEVGRGTSTYDGLSIAWSVIDYIHHHIGAKTLFSTHYHELTDLEESLPGVANYKAAVKEKHHDIIFLRKVVEGTSDKSYGIQVAKLAGLPEEVLQEAREILLSLENQHHGQPEPILLFDKRQLNRSQTNETGTGSVSREERRLRHPAAPDQREVNPEYKRFLHDVKAMDVMNMTPLEALNRLYELQKEAGELVEPERHEREKKGETGR